MRFWARSIVAGLILACVFDATWWLLLANGVAPGDDTETVTIPAGTAAAIARGEPFAFVASRFELPPGGRLRVVNNDAVEHAVGSTSIPPGRSADVEASAGGQLTCTIHPAGHLDITVDGRPPLAAMATLTVLITVSTAMSAWIFRSATR